MANGLSGRRRGVIDHICAQHRQTLQHSHQVSNIIARSRRRPRRQPPVTATLRIRRGAAQADDRMGRYIDAWSRRTIAESGQADSIRDHDEVRDVTAMYEHDGPPRPH
jgi:hypothetical protein